MKTFPICCAIFLLLLLFLDVSSHWAFLLLYISAFYGVSVFDSDHWWAVWSYPRCDWWVLNNTDNESHFESSLEMGPLKLLTGRSVLLSLMNFLYILDKSLYLMWQVVIRVSRQLWRPQGHKHWGNDRNTLCSLCCWGCKLGISAFPRAV